ncbi:glycosyltransferase, partial [Nocardiopsis trehalosi]|uniref:glycosyltransferase n=1 Tax=Nocardiopsis trehalosi TaxID=109329 RepID=UPI0024814350
MLADLVALCRDWRPDLVVWEATTFSGGVAAEACGAAHVRFVWSLDLFSRMRGWFLRRRAEAGAVEDPLGEWLGERGGRFGVEFSESLVRGRMTVDQTPLSLRVGAGEGVDYPVEYVPVRYVPFNGRAVVPGWLRRPPVGGGRRVAVSLGTSTVEWYGGYSVAVGEVVEALGGVDAEVVVTLPGGGGLGRVPGNVRVVEYVPLHALVPWCSAVVCQGGPGTVFTSLAWGVPMVVVPRAGLFDAPLLAERVAGVGAGVALDAGSASGGVVVEALGRVLDEGSFAVAAGGVAG